MIFLMDDSSSHVLKINQNAQSFEDLLVFRVNNTVMRLWQQDGGVSQ